MMNQTKHHSTDAATDITQAAFKELWRLWQNNQDIGDDASAWDRIVKKAEAICNQAKAAADPEFVRQFSYDVLESLDRIAAQRQ